MYYEFQYLNAKNMCVSIDTFIHSTMLFSKNLNNLFTNKVWPGKVG